MSAISVVNVSPDGFWLLIEDRELFVGFAQFPWFKDATIAEIADVQLPSPHHLYWPDEGEGDAPTVVRGVAKGFSLIYA
jgi:hypothetical protein